MNILITYLAMGLGALFFGITLVLALLFRMTTHRRSMYDICANTQDGKGCLMSVICLSTLLVCILCLVVAIGNTTTVGALGG
ncbi:MAG: hypothetical protein R2911_29135 [Caldilineaceae bacterium]